MKYFIFDFDGTIADSYPVIKEISHQLLDLDDFDYSKIRDIGLYQFIDSYDIPKLKIPLLIYKFQKHMVERINEIKPIKGMVKVIDELSATYKLAILSSNSKSSINVFLKNHNLEKYFEFVFSSGLFGKSSGFKVIMDKYNISSKDIIYVGDEDRDIISAKKSKIKVVAVTWGFNSKHLLKKHNPDYLIDKPDELLRFL